MTAWSPANTTGVTAFNTRTGAVTPGNADYLAVASGGLTGAVAATRYVGGTAAVAPTTGTFAVGDFVIARTGKVWICTVAGTPGTWVDPSASSGGLASVASTGNAGYTLINGTGTILSYTTPNDGALHPVVVTFAAHLAGASGGDTNFNIGGTSVQALMGSQLGAAGWFTAVGVGGGDVVMSLPANTAVTITQDQPLGAGSGILYIQILSA